MLRQRSAHIHTDTHTLRPIATGRRLAAIERLSCTRCAVDASAPLHRQNAIACLNIWQQSQLVFEPARFFYTLSPHRAPAPSRTDGECAHFSWRGTSGPGRRRWRRRRRRWRIYLFVVHVRDCDGGSCTWGAVHTRTPGVEVQMNGTSGGGVVYIYTYARAHFAALST